MANEERVQFKLMVPAHLKARLEELAHENRRSLSAEIIARLENSIGVFHEGEPSTGFGDSRTLIRELKEVIRRHSMTSVTIGDNSKTD